MHFSFSWYTQTRRHSDHDEVLKPYKNWHWSVYEQTFTILNVRWRLQQWRSELRIQILFEDGWKSSTKRTQSSQCLNRMIELNFCCVYVVNLSSFKHFCDMLVMWLFKMSTNYWYSACILQLSFSSSVLFKSLILMCVYLHSILQNLSRRQSFRISCICWRTQWFWCCSIWLTQWDSIFRICVDMLLYLIHLSLNQLIFKQLVTLNI